jgi:hypothetical protein
MAKIGRNNPCPCGSGKKFKKCCIGKKPRNQIIMVGSPEPLRGFQYDKKKMEFMGITADGRLIKPEVTYSQTQYVGQSGKEKVIARIQDKVIPDQGDLMKYLSSSFDLIIAVDTNTKLVTSEIISVTGVVHCIAQTTSDSDTYHVDFPWHGAALFRNCPNELPAEKFGWITVMQETNRDPQNIRKRFALVTDHDLDNHLLYNRREKPIFRDFYMPDNFVLMYGRGDGPNHNLLNYLIRLCDKESTELLKEIQVKGYYQLDGMTFLIDQIPVPVISSASRAC